MRPLLLLLVPFVCSTAHAKRELDLRGTQTRDVVFLRRGDRSLSLRLLRPAKLSGQPLPVVLYFHGGAWQFGSHEKLSPTLVELARNGIAVASAEFRSSDEAHFPAQLDDARAAVRWIKENARAYSLSPTKLGAYGVSTGGQLAGLLAYSGSSVRAVCLQSAPCDLLCLSQGSRVAWDVPTSPLGAYLGVAPKSKPELVRRASPIFFADENAPPTLLLVGSSDNFIAPEQSRMLHRALHKAGAKVQLIEFPGEKHDLRHVEEKVTRAVVGFFRRELG